MLRDGHGKLQHICDACHDSKLRPACAHCEERPVKLLPYAPKLYLCDACRYPPCAGLCGRQRPRNGKYSVTVLPRWRCKVCTQAQCAQPRSQLADKSRLCPHCAHCGERPEKLLPYSPVTYICKSCLVPPCQGCGRQRPREGKYSVTVLPQWLCTVCVEAQCE